MMNEIEKFMNRLSDMDWGWWPVLFLRPARDKEFDNMTVLKLSLVFGSLVGVLFMLIALIATRTITLGVFVLCILLGWVLYFAVYKATFAYFWNRRAMRLRGKEPR